MSDNDFRLLKKSLEEFKAQFSMLTFLTVKIYLRKGNKVLKSIEVKHNKQRKVF